ncbi:MAG: sigma-70 family RNA polymerase sigma factor [bacterium]|nr:sigma-70 family RNA polymerase sigma factor [bacterium]
MQLAWTMEMTAGAAPDTDSGETRLIAASLGGDRDAFSELVRLHQSRVFRLAGRFFRGREDIEDAAQDTFLTAWRKLATYRAEAPFPHWLTRVCLNCCYAKLRKQKSGEQALEPLPEPAAPGHDPDAGLEIERLMRHVAPKDRFVLLLLDGEGWSIAEIAERVGWSQVNVKVRAHRARKKLRQLLEQGS